MQAGRVNPLGRLWYQGMDANYFTNFSEAYLTAFNPNFDKPGLNLTAISSNMTVNRFRRRGPGTQTGSATAFLLTTTPTVATAHTERGAPAVVEILVEASIDPTSHELTLNYTLQWQNKTACHAPETIWVSNIPKAANVAGWRLGKLGSALNPIDANLTDASDDGVGSCYPRRATCGVHLHAVQAGASYLGGEGRMELESFDTALLSVGSATPVPTPLATPDPRGGMHWALVGNIWNTNYPFWYPFVPEDAAARFRFRLSFV